MASLTAVPVWDPARPASPFRARVGQDAPPRCCSEGMLGDPADDLAAFEDGLRAASQRQPGLAGRHPLAGLPLADLLLAAWARARHRDGPATAAAPAHAARRRRGRDADRARGTAARGAACPTVDVCHANANGLSSLVALAAKWRDRVPFLMTEHGVYLRERYLSRGRGAPGVKVALLRFHRALARLAYAEADLIAPVSGFNQRWEERHGADPAQIAVIPNGVDPHRFPPLHDEPAAPTISWVGRIDPLKDLETLIRALRPCRATVPDARLHLAGPVPAGNADYAQTCRQLVADSASATRSTSPGRCPAAGDAFEAGHVAALSSISEGMPYTVIEAMMCAPRDGQHRRRRRRRDGRRRRGRGAAARPGRLRRRLRRAAHRHRPAPRPRRGGRARALDRYTLDRCLSAYRDRYGQVA